MAYIIKRNIRYICESNLYWIILSIISCTRNLKIKMECISSPNLKSILRFESIINFFFEGHNHSLEICFNLITSRSVSSNVPMYRRRATFRYFIKGNRKSLLLFFHCGKRKTFRKVQCCCKIFQSISLRVVYNKHLHIKHFFKPSYFATNNQIEIF